MCCPGGLHGTSQRDFQFCLKAHNGIAEYVMAGRIGKPEFVTKKGLQLCFDAPIVQHSYKPDAFYSMLRRSTYGPRLDMFSRRNIPDFTAWGDGNEL